MIEVYIDGGSAGNPGPSGAGVFINNNGQLIRKAFPLHVMSNHEAEFQAIIKALTLCKELGFRVISIRTDSQVLENALEKKYVKSEKFRFLLDEALKQMDHDFDHVFVKWIPSKQNKEADQLAKKAILMAKEKFSH
ncbi:reverse transcriptase-like protein [Evansella cellulosilytica]|uniref:Ribonuclease H n=1 Tax=Evansella cellulosilytica (strain ATCC 21833 / DSM 2522 / FERM P-1141 / JCM 9156 / N-4) TaxID=649639 RepID=E6U290_EVAC2|nr:reverse transcriptase-like protein [Evansella cellulosilytica]ADU30468.1 ribonuclease H [Evansella cellulosilytica DSM 2522]